MSRTDWVGLIAGSGVLPVEAAKWLTGSGRKVLGLGVTPDVDPQLADHVTRYEAIPVTQWGSVVKALKEAGIDTVYLLGAVSKRALYTGVEMDERFISILRTAKDARDHMLFLAFASDLEREGIVIRSQTEALPEMIAKPGVLTRRLPTDTERNDIIFAVQMAKAIAALDIGQTVVVKHQAVLAVEAIDGTNSTLQRGAQLGNGDVVAAKVAKPNQDPRFDVPTVGPDTVRTMAECGVRVLAIEAHNTIVPEFKTMIRLADEADLTLIAVDLDEEGRDGCAS